VRVMWPGEQLVAVRDSSGRVGVLPHACPRRGVSLFFGRNDEGGLCCAYHGWKFDVVGRCLGIPNEPPGSKFRDKMRAGAYLCVERVRFVWAYIGPREPPPMPHFAVFDYSDEQILDANVLYRCNWVQALEGSNAVVAPLDGAPRT
jgi:phthalate 4,5-dioxygenase